MLKFLPADKTHRPKLIGLFAIQLREHGISISDERIAKAIDGVFADPRRGHITVAVYDGEPVGVSYLALSWTIEHGGKTSWLEELYVKPEYRGNEVGKRLLDETIALAKREGCTAIDLDVEQDHVRVENLYRRAGFRPHTRNRWVKIL